jgi:hypothetical protein
MGFHGFAGVLLGLGFSGRGFRLLQGLVFCRQMALWLHGFLVHDFIGTGFCGDRVLVGTGFCGVTF